MEPSTTGTRINAAIHHHRPRLAIQPVRHRPTVLSANDGGAPDGAVFKGRAMFGRATFVEPPVFDHVQAAIPLVNVPGWVDSGAPDVVDSPDGSVELD